MEIEDINPWWRTEKLQEEYRDMKKRDLFGKIIPYLEEKQIIAINGLRRVGKTVLMHQLIKHLLEKKEKEKILYYNFDLFEGNEKIESILKKYEKLIDVDMDNDEVFIFLDEVQKCNNWENELKLLYDNYPNLKFFISGSSSLFIEKKTKESLAGRAFTFTLKPLKFKEYLSLKDVDIGENIDLYMKKIKKHLSHYIRTGGFPELVNTKNNEKIDRYIKELVIDRVAYIDIPKSFDIEEPELLVRILSILASRPGCEVNYQNLAGDLERDRKTISNYVSYLERAFLIKKLYTYSKNLLKSERKMKKVYPASTAISYLFEAKQGRIIENAILMNSDIDFFKRENREVDFIKIGKKTEKIIPIESKYKEKVRRREIKGLINFMDKNGIREGKVITKNHKGKEKIKEKEIEFIPLWKWLLD